MEIAGILNPQPWTYIISKLTNGKIMVMLSKTTIPKRPDHHNEPASVSNINP